MNYQRNWFVAALALLLFSSPALAQWQVQNNAVPIGRGAGTIGFSFAAPSAVLGCLTSTGSGTAPSFGSTVASQCGPVTYVTTMAGLRALAAGVTPNVFMLAYATSGDGGGGNFYWEPASTAADNGGTVIQPNSLPSSGRWLRNFSDKKINVKWFGAKGDGSTDDHVAIFAARDVAIANRGVLYFPSVANFYNLATFSLDIQDATRGFAISCDTSGAFSVFSNDGGGQINSTNSTATLNIFSNIGSGSVGDFANDKCRFLNTGSGGGAGIRVWNALFGTISNPYGYSASGAGITIQGSGVLTLNNPIALSTSATAGALEIGDGGGTLTNSGSLMIMGGQSQHLNLGTPGGPAIKITGDPLSVTFSGCHILGQNTISGAVTLEGPASGTPVGSVDFYTCHGESTWNATSTANYFDVGETRKFGHLGIYGGNYWGHGDDGINVSQDFLKVGPANATDVIAHGIIVSKLGAANGFTRSMFRLESTPTTYSFRNNTKTDIGGVLYSDTSGKLTGQTGDASNANQVFASAFSLSGTLTPAALSGDVNDYNPTGLSASTTLRLDGGVVDRNITGIAGGLDGRLLSVINVGTTNKITFVNQSASSAAANRLSVGLDIVIDPDKPLTLRYDGATGRWRPWDAIYSSTSVPISRTINTTSPLTGGGNLSADRTFACPTCGVTGNPLSQFAATTSAQLAGVISDETGSGPLVFGTSPSLTTPNIGVATATSVNKVAITAPASGATLTLPDGVTLTGPAASGTAMTLGNAETVTGAKTFGGAGAVGKFKLAGTTSGSTIVDASAVASGTITIPAATDTLVGKATPDILTNKTYDTAGTGNSFSINSLPATANTGTGSVVRATSPALVTPNIGVATATSVNKLAITAPATSSTLAVADGKTLTASNTITLTGTDGITVPFGTRTRCVIILTSAATCNNGGSQANNGTYTTPSNVKYISIRLVGGGAGGGGSGTSGGNGGNGSNTTFSTLTGSGATTTGGGAATGGSFNVAGGTGSGGTNVSPGWGGASGGTPFANVAAASPNVAGFSAPANTGAGGGGAGTNATNPTGYGGGAGGYVEHVITSPSATYSYAVGTGGAAGTAGTGGLAGGAGAAGIIIVDEFYQ